MIERRAPGKENDTLPSNPTLSAKEKGLIAAAIAPGAVVSLFSGISQVIDFLNSKRYILFITGGILLVALPVVVITAILLGRGRYRLVAGTASCALVLAIGGALFGYGLSPGPAPPQTAASPTESVNPTPSALNPSQPNPPQISGVPTPTSCLPSGQDGSKSGKVVSLVQSSYPVSAGPASYKLVPVAASEKMQLEVGGELRGSIPPGKKLFLLGWADPGTRDSTPRHNPGNGTYYRSDLMRLTGSCWLRPQNPIAYPGAQGLTFRQLLVLVDNLRVPEFTSAKYDLGYDDIALDTLGVTRLAYFDVPTP